MAKAVWQGYVTDSTGAIVSGAEVRVYVESSGAAATLYEDRDGTPLPGGWPAFSDDNGFVQFYVDPARIRVEAYDGGQVAQFDNVLAGTVDDGGIVTANLADGAVTRAKVNEDIVTQVATITALRALTGLVDGQVVEVGGEKPAIWRYTTDDISADVNGDDFVGTDADPTGASGGFYREGLVPAKFVRPYNSSDVDILIVYGQSNARGYAASSPGAPNYKVPLARVWDGTAFQEITSYTPTANDGTSTGSAWLAFANEYCKQTSRSLVVLNAAKGSQSISDLQKGGAEYTALTGWFSGATAALAAEGSTAGRVIVAFNQGERDSDLGTAPATYYSALGTLWTDLKIDFGAEIMGLYTVGYYADSRMIHGQVIQQAQRLFARDNDDVILAYDNLGSFGSHNKLKVDGVHYNQRGYNIMGREGAKALVSALYPDTDAPASDPLIKRFGGLTFGQSQAWNMHAGVIRKITDGDWSVNHSSPHASSMILDATPDSDKLSVKLACPARTILNFSANFGGALQSGGMRASVGSGINSASGIAASVDADGYSYAGVFFKCDVYLRIDMAAGTYDVSAMGTAFGGLLDDISVTFPSAGRCDITHGASAGLTQGSIIGASGRELRVNAGTTTTLIQLRDSAGALINDTISVLIPSMTVSPASIPDTADLSFQVIAADYAVW